MKYKNNLLTSSTCLLILLDLSACQAGVEPLTTAATAARAKSDLVAANGMSGVAMDHMGTGALTQTTPELTRASVARMRTPELARRLLPSPLATQMVSHEVGEPIFAGGPLRSIRFFARPAPLGDDLCRRESVYVALQVVGGSNAENSRQDVPVQFEGAMPAKTQIAIAPGCRLEAGGFFAWVQPERAFDSATRAFRRLLSFRERAQSVASFPVSVTCTSETQEKVCNGSTRALLARLPLHQTYLIEPRGAGWKFAVMPNGPGQHYWEVILAQNGATGQKVALTWRVPAPF